MEMQIQDLIDSIRKDGLDKARTEADALLENARKEADRILRDAEEKAEKMRADATKDIELEKKSARATLEQAARDASLSFRKNVEKELDLILKEETSKALDAKMLETLIEKVVSSELTDGEVAVELSAKDADAISRSFVAELAKKLDKGIEVKASAALQGGFVVRSKDGSGYIDLSDDEIGKLLYPYLSESLRGLI